MYSLLLLIDQILNIYMIILIATVVCSWLIAFNVINTHNRFVYTVVNILHRLTEPLLAPLRRILPNLGGLDISPIVLWLLLLFTRNLLWEYFGPTRGQ